MFLARSASLRLSISFLRTLTKRARRHSIRNEIPSDVSYLAASLTVMLQSLIINSVALYEYMTRFTFPLCTHLPHVTSPTPISSTTSIIDLGDVSLSSLWQLRHHLQEASSLSTANYPETLHHVAIVNSPSFFPTIWRWIRVGSISIYLETILMFCSRAGSTKALVVKYMFWEEIQDPP